MNVYMMTKNTDFLSNEYVIRILRGEVNRSPSFKDFLGKSRLLASMLDVVQIEKTIDANPRILLKSYADRLTRAQFMRAVASDPEGALKYCVRDGRRPLSLEFSFDPDRMDLRQSLHRFGLSLMEQDRATAVAVGDETLASYDKVGLRYLLAHHPDRLTPRELSFAALEEPLTAVNHCWARLPERLAARVMRALCDRFSDEDLARLVGDYPELAKAQGVYGDAIDWR